MKNNRFKGFLKKAFSGRMAIVSSIVALILVGATLAYLFSVGKSIVNTFTPGSVDVVVEEVITNDAKTSIILTNKDGKTDAFLRASIVTYYIDGDGNVVGSIPATLNAFELNANWVKHTDGYYYYTVPVAPDDSTPNLFATEDDNITLGSFTQTNGDTTVIYQQVVEVFAEAIQSAPVEAVQEAWGEGFSIDSNGNLVVPAT